MIEAVVQMQPRSLPRVERMTETGDDLDRFLEASARYFLDPQEFRRIDRQALRTIGLMPARLDRMLDGIRLYTGK